MPESTQGLYSDVELPPLPINSGLLNIISIIYQLQLQLKSLIIPIIYLHIYLLYIIYAALNIPYLQVTFLPNFKSLAITVLEISCLQTDRQTDTQTHGPMAQTNFFGVLRL
uniref:Uncharacterized protein n=1 Tax=Cacopsylla melanoneura TaxID=428564 RepID=A0A8D8X9F8_9HEMI